MHAIEWSLAAARDLQHIESYIEKLNPSAAERVARAIAMAVKSLKDMPFRAPQGRIAGTRELSHPRYPYKIVYTVQTKKIFIVRVLHSAQDWPPDQEA